MGGSFVSIMKLCRESSISHDMKVCGAEWKLTTAKEPHIRTAK